MTTTEIIKALRCSVLPNPTMDCNTCPYNREDRITKDDELYDQIIPDRMDGDVKVWSSCDCDRMVLDAAEALEKLEEKINGI